MSNTQQKQIIYEVHPLKSLLHSQRIRLLTVCWSATFLPDEHLHDFCVLGKPKSWSKAGSPPILPRWHFWVGEMSVVKETLLERFTGGEAAGGTQVVPWEAACRSLEEEICGRGLLFMLFQAGPYNCLDKFTWMRSAFFRDGKVEVLCFPFSVGILACCMDSVCPEQEITGFLLEFPLQNTAGFQLRCSTDLQIYYGSLLRLTSL